MNKEYKQKVILLLEEMTEYSTIWQDILWFLYTKQSENLSLLQKDILNLQNEIDSIEIRMNKTGKKTFRKWRTEDLLKMRPFVNMNREQLLKYILENCIEKEE